MFAFESGEAVSAGLETTDGRRRYVDRSVHRCVTSPVASAFPSGSGIAFPRDLRLFDGPGLRARRRFVGWVSVLSDGKTIGPAEDPGPSDVGIRLGGRLSSGVS